MRRVGVSYETEDEEATALEAIARRQPMNVQQTEKT
jgi:hypothetical protein